MSGRLQHKVWFYRSFDNLILQTSSGCSYHWRWLVSRFCSQARIYRAIACHHWLHGRGIGLESSILFALEGANVLLVDINQKAVEEAAAKIAKKAPNVKVVATRADVSKEEDIKAAVDKAVAEFGRLDIMVGGVSYEDNACDWQAGSSTTLESCIPQTITRWTRRRRFGIWRCKSTSRASGGAASMRFWRWETTRSIRRKDCRLAEV